MDDWKSCENCNDRACYVIMARMNETEEICDSWEPMRCRCGGALSTTRVHNGRKYRHCYSCHFEFFEEEEEHLG